MRRPCWLNALFETRFTEPPIELAGESGVGVLETSTREMLFIMRPPTSMSRVEPEEAALATGLPSTRMGVVSEGMPRTEIVRASNEE